MGSVQNQNPWPPSNYIYNDCSQRICSIYCPQWCYMIFPPPPVDDYSNSGVDFSPVIIAVIGILATALILVSCYTIVSKYRRRQRINAGDNATYAEQILDIESRPSAGGLDESIIKLITVFKYKQNEGFVDNTDCSVCLSEFQENESLRVLPLCSHAFHISCIDIWLKSQANCPLCRANILPPPPPPTPPEETPAGNTTRVAMVQDLERVVEEDSEVVSVPKPEGQEIIRRSLSLNSCSVYRNQVSIADILRTDEDDDDDEDGVIDLENNRVGVIDNISHRFGAMSGNDRGEALGMRRSISTGRFKFTS